VPWKRSNEGPQGLAYRYTKAEYIFYPSYGLFGLKNKHVSLLIHSMWLQFIYFCPAYFDGTFVPRDGNGLIT